MPGPGEAQAVLSQKPPHLGYRMAQVLRKNQQAPLLIQAPVPLTQSLRAAPRSALTYMQVAPLGVTNFKILKKTTTCFYNEQCERDSLTIQ